MRAPNQPSAAWPTNRCTAAKSKSMKPGRAKSAVAAAVVVVAAIAAVVAVAAADAVHVANRDIPVINFFRTLSGADAHMHPPCAPLPLPGILFRQNESGTTN